jgi:hypothetical protein
MRSIAIHRASFGAAAAALAAAGLAACTTIGVGNGQLQPGNTPVELNWSSDDGGMSGVMSARLGTGVSFTGPFAQITQQERTLTSEGPGESWPGVWDGWGTQVTYPGDGVATLYSGAVEANLAAAGGRRMRCHFTLNAPVAGMNGGGQGACQLDDGRTVDAVLRRG